jgi:hypothetical protein
MSARWRSIAVLVLGLAAMAALGVCSALAASAEAGEALARTHCARCHVLPGEGNMGLGSTPSFRIMVTSPIADWRERFESFYALRPHPNFVRIRELPWTVESLPVAAPFTLSLADIADLMAYVDRLAAEHRK